MRVVSGIYLRLGIGCRETKILGADRLAELFRDALSGDIRLILAFRHPYVDEPQILGRLFLRGVEEEARKSGIRLPRRPHAIFVHGYEVLRWNGPLVRWLLPRLGALPVYHTRIDSVGMIRIRQAIANGAYPVALAPEGQVSYTSERVPRLETGTMRLALETAAEAAAAACPETDPVPVIVLPLSVHRRFQGTGPRRALERLLRRTESFLGIPTLGIPTLGITTLGIPTPKSAEISVIGPGRLPTIVDRLLRQGEALYGLKRYGLKRYGLKGEDSKHHEPAVRDERLRAIVDEAVRSGERLLGLEAGHGGVIDRVYRIRQVGWDRIFIAEDPRSMSRLERAIADRRAGEAWYAMRHMELADFAWYFRTSPPLPEDPLDLQVEYTQNLWDFANRLAGGTISGRRQVRPFQELVVVGEPINVTDRIPEFLQGRKATINRATEDLRDAFLACAARARSFSRHTAPPAG